MGRVWGCQKDLLAESSKVPLKGPLSRGPGHDEVKRVASSKAGEEFGSSCVLGVKEGEIEARRRAQAFHLKTEGDCREIARISRPRDLAGHTFLPQGRYSRDGKEGVPETSSSEDEDLNTHGATPPSPRHPTNPLEAKYGYSPPSPGGVITKGLFIVFVGRVEGLCYIALS